MWGLAEDIGSGMRACLASSADHPAGGPRLSSHIGKTLFSASSCLLRCPSDQTRVACEQRSLAGRGCVPPWLTFSVELFCSGLVPQTAHGPWDMGKVPGTVGHTVSLQTFLTSGLDQAPSNSSEEL